MSIYELHCGDCLSFLSEMDTGVVDCCVTSPPYYGLRDYGVDGQIGLEQSPDEYVAKLVAVFREVRRVLRNDGTLWLNLGDSYATGTKADRQQSTNPGVGANRPEAQNSVARIGNPPGCKTKDLIGIPWMLAFALRADGWYLRQDIIWHKPNPMPESVRDRCTKAHEYIFLLSKAQKYFFDNDVIRQPLAEATLQRDKSPRGRSQNGGGSAESLAGYDYGREGLGDMQSNPKGANRRSVWTVATRPYKGAHFATFPPALIEPCVLAGSRKNGVVLDPFNGSGTTGEVAIKNSRRYVGIELNPAYIQLAEARIGSAVKQTSGLLF